jgi:hypothetical protein
MPPLPYAPGCVKIVVAGHVDDGDFLNIFHVGYAGATPSTTQLAGYITTIHDALVYPYNHNGSLLLGLDSIEATDLSSDTGAVYSTTDSTVGTVEGSVLPISSAVVVSWEVNRRWRGGHPRTYYPLGTAGTLEGSSTKDWQASFLTNVQNDAEAWRVASDAGTIDSTTWYGLVNLSYYTAKELRPTPVLDPVVSTIARPRICTQRRRLGKVGG